MYFFVKNVNIKRSEACGKINAVSLTAFMGKVLQATKCSAFAKDDQLW